MLMEKIRIASEEHRLYKPFLKLYSGAFPIYEQRTYRQQQWAFNNPEYQLIAYCEGDEMLGFISAWKMQDCIYIEHFAIEETQRGKGYGSRILQAFCAESDEPVVLEIDPVCDAITAARLRFYQHCGFVENRFEHIHPPYRTAYNGHRLTLMSTGKELSIKEFAQFTQDLKKVMACPPES